MEPTKFSIENIYDELRFIKDLEEKTNYLKKQISELNNYIKHQSNLLPENNIERLNSKKEYFELISLKQYLSLELSMNSDQS